MASVSMVFVKSLPLQMPLCLFACFLSFDMPYPFFVVVEIQTSYIG